MNRILSSAFLGALLTVGVALAAQSSADPVVGSWKLDPSKSSFTAGPALKSQTRVYSQSDDSYTLNMTSVTADGKQTTQQTTYHLDGKDYPVTGAPDFDGLSGKKIDSNTAEFTLKKAGKAVGTTRRTVSKDGKTLTATTKVTNAKGEKVENRMVFDKQ